MELSRLHGWNRPWRCGWDSFKGWSRAFSEHKSFRILGNRALELQLESAPRVPAFPLARENCQRFSLRIISFYCASRRVSKIDKLLKDSEKFWLSYRVRIDDSLNQNEEEEKKKERRNEREKWMDGIEKRMDKFYDRYR